MKQGGFCSGIPVCFLCICQIGNLGAVTAVGEARTGGQFAFPEWQLISQRDSNSPRKTHGQGACQPPASHSCTLVMGRMMFCFGLVFFEVKPEVLLQGESNIQEGADSTC